jgi:hypothetical protein
MPRVRRLEDDDSRAAYAAAYRALSGIALSPDHLRRASVFGVVDEAGAIRGGFVLNRAPPFRTLEAIPPDRRPPAEGGLVDLSAVFLDAALRQGLHAARFGAQLAWNVATCGASAVVFGVVVAPMNRFALSVPGAEEVYRGPLSIDGQSAEGWIYRAGVRAFGLGTLAWYFKRRRREARAGAIPPVDPEPGP